MTDRTNGHITPNSLGGVINVENKIKTSVNRANLAPRFLHFFCPGFMPNLVRNFTARSKNHCLATLKVSWCLRFPVMFLANNQTNKNVLPYTSPCWLDKMLLFVALYWYRNYVCLSVRHVPVLYRNGFTYRHNFLHHTVAQIILVLRISNIFAKFRRSHPLRGR